MSSRQLKLFVQGRLCLFGEHSDWASLHRVMNAQIVPGHAIVTGVEQGIYATVTESDKFIVESEIESFKSASFECEMDSAKILPPVPPVLILPNPFHIQMKHS